MVLLLVLYNFYVVPYFFHILHGTTYLRFGFPDKLGQLSIVGYFDFFVVYVISSFSHHQIKTMTEISASPNKEVQEQEINIKEFMNAQKQFMESMPLMFHKHATATSMTHSSGPYRSRTDEKGSNDASQQESHNRDIPEKAPGASRKKNVCNRMIKIVKIESHYTPHTEIVT